MSEFFGAYIASEADVLQAQLDDARLDSWAPACPDRCGDMPHLHRHHICDKGWKWFDSDNAYHNINEGPPVGYIPAFVER